MEKKKKNKMCFTVVLALLAYLTLVGCSSEVWSRAQLDAFVLDGGQFAYGVSDDLYMDPCKAGKTVCGSG